MFVPEEDADARLYSTEDGSHAVKHPLNATGRHALDSRQLVWHGHGAVRRLGGATQPVPVNFSRAGTRTRGRLVRKCVQTEVRGWTRPRTTACHPHRRPVAWRLCTSPSKTAWEPLFCRRTAGTVGGVGAHTATVGGAWHVRPPPPTWTADAANAPGPYGRRAPVVGASRRRRLRGAPVRQSAAARACRRLKTGLSALL